MSYGTVKPRVVCRLSPNEEAALLRQQREERRKARLLEVREQENNFAKKVRDNVKAKREEERRAVEEQLQAVIAASEEAELRELETHYLCRQKQIGQGHKQAQHIIEEENRLLESKLHLKAEQRWQAKQRHNAAMKELTMNQLRELEAAQHPLMARKRALAVEKERARHIAVNKPHPTQPLIKDLAVGRGRKVQLKEAEGFASTYYNIPTTIVQRVVVHHEGKPSAQDMAEATMKQDESFVRHSSAAHQEHQEKAWLRHKHALAKVKLEREKSDVISQLRALEREDRAHRQKSLAKMPTNMFQHTQRRVEIGCEQQRDMEQAFEGLFIKTHGVRNHPTLSRIASASKPDGSPSPSDTIHSSTAGNHPSTGPELSDQPGDERQPQAHSEEKPSVTHILKNDSRTKSGSTQPSLSPFKQPLQSPKLQAGQGARDPSLPMLSSDFSSVQPREGSLQPQPFSTCVSSIVSNFPPKATPATTVRVPSGEPGPSDNSFESTGTNTSGSTATSDENSPPFRHAVPHTDMTRAATNAINADDLRRAPDVTVGNVTLASDVPELSSTASKSITSSSSGDDTKDDGRKPQLPIKGILKHTAEKKVSAGGSSLPTSKEGGGMQRLVSLVRAQHQAWSERLAARASLLQSTLAHNTDRVSPAPPLAIASSVSNQHPPPLSHDQGLGGAVHHHLPTSLLHSAGDVASHSYAYPQALLHSRDREGVSLGGHSSAAQQDSLSIFTLSTRDSTTSPELSVAPSNMHCDPSAVQREEDVESTLQPETPEPLSITQYHTTLDSFEAPSPHQPDASPECQPGSRSDPAATGQTSCFISPATTSGKLGLSTKTVGAAEMTQLAYQPMDTRVYSPHLQVSGPPSQPSHVVQDSQFLETVFQQSTSQVLPPKSQLHSESKLHVSPSPTAASAPFHSNWTLTSPFTPTNTAQIPSQYPFQFHHGQYPFPFHQGAPLPPQLSRSQVPPSPQHTPEPLSSPLPCSHIQQPLTSSNPVPTTTAIFAIPTPKSSLLPPSPLPFSCMPPPSTQTPDLPPDFHQLSFATPVALQGATTASQTTDHFHDLSPHSIASESPLQLRTTELPHLVAPPAHNIIYSTHPAGMGVSGHHSKLKPAASLRPPHPQNTNITTDLERPEATAATSVPSENLSIFTLETSHTHSETPALLRSPSPSTSSSSVSSEEQRDANSTPDGSHTSDGPHISDHREDDTSTSESETDRSDSEPELELEPQEEHAVDHDGSVQLCHLPLPSAAVGDDEQDKTEDVHIQVSRLGATGPEEVPTELKHPHDVTSVTSSSEESHSSSNSSHYEQFVSLPDKSPGGAMSEDIQSLSPSLEDGSSGNSELDITQGTATQLLTLQEAFLRRKEQFILKSQDRLRQLKVNAEKRQAETSPVFAHITFGQNSGRSLKPPTPPTVHQGHGYSIRNGTNAEQSLRTSNTTSADVKRREVTFSSPLAVPQDTGRFSPPRFLGAVSGDLAKPQPLKFLSSQKREKIRRKEMKERNMRFYNKLPEVKRQREEEKRKQAYSANREKAKEYQEKLRIKVKQQGENKHTHSSQPVTKAQPKQLPKRPPFR